LVSCGAVALGPGALGGRARGRDVAIGTVFAWILGLGVLFLALYTAARSATAGAVGVSVLFGSILSIAPDEAVIASVTALVAALIELWIARPLMLLSVDADVAAARGVPVRALSGVFLVLVALTVAVSVHAVGALLIFALLVSPAAAARNLTARPALGMALSAAIAVASVWAGLVLAYYVALPPSFFIVAIAFSAYVATAIPWSRLAPPAAVLILLASVACGVSSAPAAGARTQVVAAESFWGSIAAQVTGDAAHVTSIVANPATDPHDYEATPADARAIASAQYVIVNGAGYDSWASQLIAANPVSGRRVLDVAAFLGKRQGDNPHFWYSPDFVTQVVRKIASDLGVSQRGESFLNETLREYHFAIATIKAKHSGTKIGATESMFVYLAPALGLDLITPPGYMSAVAAGSNPSAADKASAEAQAAAKQISVLVFNSQNATPDVNALVAKARAAGVPVVAMTETPPRNEPFQDWQTEQLNALLAALGG
jgi:zinc/manganese transport system substrate-binding protein